MEGMFGGQTEFPVGNRDRDIDEAIAELTADVSNWPMNEQELNMLTNEVLVKVEEKYGIDIGILVPGPTSPEIAAQEKRVMDFLDLYDIDYIKSRLSAHIESK
jgi:hypothetical protein